MSELVSVIGDIGEWIAKVEEAVHEAVSEQTKETVNEVVELSKEMAPVVTGNLRDHITGEVSAGGHYGRIRIKAKDVPYAPYVLFGTVNMPGNPFIQQSADQVTAGYGNRIKDAIKEKADEAGIGDE